MMDIAEQLERNKHVFLELLKDVPAALVQWRPGPDKWCLLDIVCHLYDEECLDFRFRVRWVLDKPGEIPPPFNPIDWVSDHNYAEQDYELMLHKFLAEREQSVRWLQTLKTPIWDNHFEHPKLGKLTARYFLENWLAHDYLHIRQISKLKFDYLESNSGSNLNYAGTW